MFGLLQQLLRTYEVTGDEQNKRPAACIRCGYGGVICRPNPRFFVDFIRAGAVSRCRGVNRVAGSGTVCRAGANRRLRGGEYGRRLWVI